MTPGALVRSPPSALAPDRGDPAPARARHPRAAYRRTDSMVQTCTQCSRANPPEAVYCYFDGFVLGDHARRGGPVAVGSQPFAHPFVFPGGRSCRSFDELALA